MTPRMMSAMGATNLPRGSLTQANHPPSALTTFTRRLSSNPIANAVANSILELDVPDEDGNVSLYRGFQATNPAAAKSKQRRRDVRANASDNDRALALSSRKKLRESLGGKSRSLPKDELTRQTNEIMKDKENITVRRSIITNEIEELQRKINKLEVARQKMEKELLKLVEEELELDDERESSLSIGVQILTTMTQLGASWIPFLEVPLAHPTLIEHRIPAQHDVGRDPLSSPRSTTASHKGSHS